MRCGEIVMSIINEPTKTNPLAAIVYKRLFDARRLMNRKKDRLQQAMRAFVLMKKKGKRRQPPVITVSRRAAAHATRNHEEGDDATSQSETNEETLLDGTIAMEPNAIRNNEEACTHGGASNRNLFPKKQGPVAGMAQAVILLGGKLEMDRGGFCVTFDEAFPRFT